MRTVEEVLAWWQRSEGLGENPPGSNCNWITRWFGLGCVAWCVESVSRCLNVCWGNPDKWQIPNIQPDYAKGFAYVWSFFDGFENIGAVGMVPKVGAAVAYNWNGAGKVRNSNSHLAMVVETYDDGTFLDAGGNVHDVIRYTRRSMQFVEGFCYVEYDEPVPGPGPQPIREELMDSFLFMTDSTGVNVWLAWQGKRYVVSKENLDAFKAAGVVDVGVFNDGVKIPVGG